MAKKVKKSAASATGAGGTKPKRRGGGRKPGKWTLTSPDELRAFRASTKTSRARLAEMLGVSPQSVLNWESKTVATPKLQAKLAKVIKGGGAAAPTGTAGRTKRGVGAPAVRGSVGAT